MPSCSLHRPQAGTSKAELKIFCHEINKFSYLDQSDYPWFSDGLHSFPLKQATKEI